MKNLNIIFLLLVSNLIIAMEAERKSLASFFDIDQFTQHEDAPKAIAPHCFFGKQWWYVDKEIQFIYPSKYSSRLPYPNYLRSVCFDSTNTKIIAFSQQHDCFACIWDRDGKELERLDFKAFDKFREKNIEWANKLYESGNSPGMHQYGEVVTRWLEEKFRFGAMLCFNEEQAFVAPQFGVHGGDTVHAWSYLKDTILFSLHHNDIINSVDFNPQGIEIITASADGPMRLWHQKTGKELLCFTYDKRVTSATFNGVGTEIVVATDDGKIQVFTQYHTDNLQQILLKKLLHLWLQLKSPSKEIDTVDNLLKLVAEVLQLNEKVLQEIWKSFSEHMREVIWASMYKKIQRYGK